MGAPGWSEERGSQREAAAERELLTQTDPCHVGGGGARLGGKDEVHMVRKSRAGKINGRCLVSPVHQAERQSSSRAAGGQENHRRSSAQVRKVSAVRRMRLLAWDAEI